jgi:multiple sugar transport system permease protein
VTGRGRRLARQAGFQLLVNLLVVAFLWPFFWMVLCSLRTQAENTSIPPTWLFTPTLDNYRGVFSRVPFVQYTVNSLVVSVSATVLGIAFGLTAAYGIALRGMYRLGALVLVARMIPVISYLVPWFVMFRAAGMIGTFPPIILTHLVLTLPFVIWLMVGFFEDMPADLIAAARVDGCSELGAFWRIAVPLAAPGTVVAAILVFNASWNNLLLALVLGGSEVRTLPVAVYAFHRQTHVDWGGMNAAAILVSLPVVVTTLLVQRHFERGLTLGGTKG